MHISKMHQDEVVIDAAGVEKLIVAQFPEWAGLSIQPVQSAGTDNVIYRIGKEFAVRLPRIQRAAEQLNKELLWLPRLAPLLPLAVPVPIARGLPGEGYPWHWSVCQWLAGEDATVGRITDLCQAASEMAEFIKALKRIDSTLGPLPGEHNFFRGVHLADRDDRTREAIAALGSSLDAAAAVDAWEAALQAPVWQGSPQWIHGDLQSGNLLVDGGAISAVIDFGGLAIGDPACDLMIAWTLFSGESRDAFRTALEIDDATWARGRGWALSVALIALPYYLTTNPVIVRSALHAIEEVLIDHE